MTVLCYIVARAKGKCVGTGYILALSQQILFIDILVHVNWAWLLRITCVASFVLMNESYIDDMKMANSSIIILTVHCLNTK